MSKRKNTARAASLEEQIYLWKEHFKNLLEKSPKVTDKPITKMINHQLDIKLGQFTQEELDVVQTKLKKKAKLLVMMKYPKKNRKQGNSMTHCSDTATPYLTKTQ